MKMNLLKCFETLKRIHHRTSLCGGVIFSG